MLTMRTREEKKGNKNQKEFSCSWNLFIYTFCGHKFKIHTMQKALKTLSNPASCKLNIICADIYTMEATKADCF